MRDISSCAVRFFRAQAQDAELLSRMRQKAWSACYRGIYPDERIDGYDFAAHAARDRVRISSGQQTIWLLMDGESCGGYFYYGPPEHGAYREFSLCLNALYILPEYQRQGLGRRVFAKLHDVCRERKLRGFFCGCNLHNLPARQFYAAMGGSIGRVDAGHACRADDQVYYEFYVGETT